MRQKLFSLIIIIVVGIILSLPLLLSGSDFLLTHDLLIHHLKGEAGAINTFRSWELPVNWNAFIGPGMPYWEFYPFLGYWLLSPFYFVAGGYIWGVKLFLFFSILLSGITMFFVSEKLFKDRTISLLSAIFYMSSSFHLIEGIYRGEFGEFFAFVLIPLSFYLFYKLLYYKKIEYFLMLVLLMSFQFLIAPGIFYITFMIFVLFIVSLNVRDILLYKKTFNKNITEYLLTILKPYAILAFLALFVSGITAFWIIPALSEDNYTYVPLVMVGGKNDFNKYFLSIDALFARVDPSSGLKWNPYPSASYSPWMQMPKYIGISYYIFTLSLFIYYKNFIKQKKHIILILATLGVIIPLLATNIAAPLWNLFPYHESILYPWRILAFSSFFLSISSAIAISLIKQDFFYDKKLLSKKAFSIRYIYILFIIALIFLDSAIYTNPPGWIKTTNFNHTTMNYLLNNPGIRVIGNPDIYLLNNAQIIPFGGRETSGDANYPINIGRLVNYGVEIPREDILFFNYSVILNDDGTYQNILYSHPFAEALPSPNVTSTINSVPMNIIKKKPTYLSVATFNNETKNYSEELYIEAEVDKEYIQQPENIKNINRISNSTYIYLPEGTQVNYSLKSNETNLYSIYVRYFQNSGLDSNNTLTLMIDPILIEGTSLIIDFNTSNDGWHRNREPTLGTNNSYITTFNKSSIQKNISIDEDGTYSIFARTFLADKERGNFKIKIDNSSELLYNTTWNKTYGAWGWLCNKNITLRKGNHSISIESEGGGYSDLEALLISKENKMGSLKLNISINFDIWVWKSFLQNITINKGNHNIFLIAENNNFFIDAISIVPSENIVLATKISYFPGWNVYLDGKKTVLLNNQYGILMVAIPPGKHLIEFIYEDTPIRFYSKILSASFVLIMIVLFIKRKKEE